MESHNDRRGDAPRRAADAWDAPVGRGGERGEVLGARGAEALIEHCADDVPTAISKAAAQDPDGEERAHEHAHGKDPRGEAGEESARHEGPDGNEQRHAGEQRPHHACHSPSQDSAASGDAFAGVGEAGSKVRAGAERGDFDAQSGGDERAGLGAIILEADACGRAECGVSEAENGGSPPQLAGDFLGDGLFMAMGALVAGGTLISTEVSR